MVWKAFFSAVPLAVCASLLLAAAVFFSSCSAEEPVWTVHCELSESGSAEAVIYEFQWDPVNNRIVGFFSEMEGFSSEGETLEEVREAGYDPQPEGFFLLDITSLIWKRDSPEGWVESPLLFQPAGLAEGASGSTDAGSEGETPLSLEGTVSTQVTIDGEPLGGEAAGVYHIDTAGTPHPAEYLAENSHTYLYRQAKMSVERGDSPRAAELLEKAIALKKNYQAARALKAQLE